MPFLFRRSDSQKHAQSSDVSTEARYDALTASSPKTSPGKASASKRPRLDDRSARPPNGSPSPAAETKKTTTPTKGLTISDVVFDPHQYTALLLQASSSRSSNDNATRPSTPLSPKDMPDVPHSTPCGSARAATFRPEDLDADARTVTSFAAGIEVRSIDALIEGITYDAILASTLNKTLAGSARDVGSDADEVAAAGYLTPPAARTPPNSPAGHVEFSSLVGVSMAIMEERNRSVA